MQVRRRSWRFDPASGLLRLLESMRYKREDRDHKTLWLNEVLEWGRLDGGTSPVSVALTWLDDGAPWARLTTDEVRWNVDVGGALRSR